jgi:hypothetical protein
MASDHGGVGTRSAGDGRVERGPAALPAELDWTAGGLDGGFPAALRRVPELDAAPEVPAGVVGRTGSRPLRPVPFELAGAL